MKGHLRSILRWVRRRLRPDATALLDLRAIFDPVWYRNEYPDLADPGLDPAEHFVNHGIREGRRPNRFFDPVWYAERYPEVGAELPLVHYARRGRAAGHDPGPGFSAAAYLATHADVARNGMDALEHYMRFGHKEGRQVFPVRGAAGAAPVGRALSTATLPPSEWDGLDVPLEAEETARRLFEQVGRRGTVLLDR